jgi:L-seryl-tRNA(Ser) seleniumtransferase
VSKMKDVPPPVNLVLKHPILAVLREHFSASFLVDLIHCEICNWQPRGDSDEQEPVSRVAIGVERRAKAMLLPRRSYVNATGIIIHTGWGNAPLHAAARHRLLEAAGASDTGARGTPSRTDTCARLLCHLTGAEASTITTQNAASLLLFAGALAAGREIVVAARDLVEIGQRVRIADILQAASARVTAVGSANCVYIEDYRRAITPQTAVVMRNHASNIATSGYTRHVASPELVALARTNQLIFVENLGGGSLVDLEERCLPACPTLQRAVAQGADLVLASGDKLIGGPQAGIVVGKKSVVSRIADHPFARTCRPGKLTLAALEATLAVYMAGRAWNEIPTLRLLSMSLHSLHLRALSIADACRASVDLEASVLEDTAECGGAVLPGVALPTWTVRIKHRQYQEDEFRNILLARGVVTRRRQDAVIVDLRSVTPEEDSLILQALNAPPNSMV